MAGNAVDTTISDVHSFKQCRMQWDFSSLMRRGLAPRHTAVHFVFGDLFHKALEQFYSGKGPQFTWQWFNEQAAVVIANMPHDTPNANKLIDELSNGTNLMRAYVRWAKRTDNFTVVNTEKRCSLRLNALTPGHFFSFKYDALVLDRQGNYWLHDYKTTSRMPTEFEWLDRDDQAVAYQWAAEQVLELPIAGMLYTFIAKRELKMPELLQSGKLSKAISTGNITFDTYNDAIEFYGLDPADYVDVLTKLKQTDGDALFKRCAVRANTTQRELMGEQIKRLVEEMARDDVFIYHNPDKMKCGWCDYNVPCQLRLAGREYERYLATEFVKAEPRE